ncbi:hypothetical protein [Vitreimonas sp.]|uniref:hypothetical protein n=1 Tax=Vitreimonas sp. TaxID=3069702 RepID=UPI002ED8EE48
MVSKLKLARGIAFALAAIALTACASGGGNGRAPRGPADEIRFDVLQPQQLNPGQCSLSLWAAGDQQPRFIMAAYDNPAQLVVRPNGRDRILPRTEFGGQRVSGIFEEQTFSDGRLTLSLDVTFDDARPMRDGAIVRRAIVRVRDDNGWETVIPVGGLAACAPR